ncbi:MAG TPA: LysR family transcriptional regulator [Ramlibacter sp.]|nr:LysR family transcriptional regulator [Ramlibacter sp.]
MNLRRLRYFVVLSEELHFGRAAERLHLAQPALTQNLRALEDEWGLELLARTSRRVELTEAGRLLQREAARLLADADALDQRMRGLAAGLAGTLRIGYARSAPGGPSQAIVEAFREAWPNVRLELDTHYTMRSVEELLARRLDAAFVRTPLAEDGGDWPGVQVLPIDSEPIVVGLPKGHRLARRKRVACADLRDEPLVTGQPSRAPGFYRRMFGQIWGERPPKVVLQEPDEEHMLRSVAAGRGVTVFTQSRSTTIQVPGVVVRPLVEPQPRAELGLAWMESNTSPLLRAFLDVARSLAE